MIDHLAGRPSPSWKRTQVFLVIFFWIWRITYGNPGGPRVLWIRRLNRALQRFTPWQIIVTALTSVYALRNLDKILGFGAPEPLANLYSPSYYRATWIVTGLDAGFMTAMNIRPRWLKDICSVLFAVYYIIYAQEGDEKLRRFRAVPTVDSLRVAWEKTTNPIIRAITYQPPVTLRRKILLPRPKGSTYTRPITAWLFFAAPAHQLARATDLVLDFPGGGFIAMSPLHHEERLRMWAIRTGKPVLSVDYGKAPEYQYPWAIHEAFDVYRVLVETCGNVIGMSRRRLNIIMSGDSAGATLVVNVMLKILETRSQLNLPSPVAIVLNYAALDFNFTSWMSPNNLRVLKSEQSSANLRNLADTKDHFKNASPLSMATSPKLDRRRSWRDSIRHPFTLPGTEVPHLRTRRTRTRPDLHRRVTDKGDMADSEDDAHASLLLSDGHLVQSPGQCVPLTQSTLEQQQKDFARQDGYVGENAKQAQLGTRLTMTSRTGYFQDRIVTPSMMRAMALLYIGPHRNPDFLNDYHISPILAPQDLLAQFPPLLMQCGEKDPFVDDTVIFAGRVREAKRARKQELDLLLAGKSARFGEHLRMSSAGGQEHDTLKLSQERDRLAAEVEHDVQMQIYSDWSHGYLQMCALMPEAKDVINDIADWMDDAFGARNDHDGLAAAGLAAAAGSLSLDAGRAGGRRPSPSARSANEVRASDGELTETDGDDPIVFMPRKQRPGRRSAGSDDTAVGTAGPQSGGGSEETLREEGGSNGKALHQGAKAVPRAKTGMTVRTGEDDGAATAEEEPGRAKSPSSKATTTAAGKGGQATVSEEELMRRRRLLDSHMFDGIGRQ